MKHKAIVILSFILLFMFFGQVYSAIPPEERAALIALYNNTKGDNWDDNSGWKGNNNEADGFSEIGSEGTWHGITVSGDHVTAIVLIDNKLDGNISAELDNLSTLNTLDLNNNNLTGSIPSTLGNLSNLVTLNLRSNRLDGSIPPELVEPGNLPNLERLYLHRNFLAGSIPPGLGNLSQLKELYLYENQLTGEIPKELGNLSELQKLHLYKNKLTGDIPNVLGSLSNLKILNLRSNKLEGSIPPELGNLLQLKSLYLYDNRLTGNIPPELGNLLLLDELYLQSNHLEGNIPSEIESLIELDYNSLDLRWNALYTDDGDLKLFLKEKQVGGKWENYQTVAPKGVTARATSAHSVEVSWEPIDYSFDPGRYRVFYSQTSGGPYTLFDVATKTKNDSLLEVTGLKALTTYYFVIQTRTHPHEHNQNTVESEYSAEVSVTTPHIDKIISGRVTEKTGEGVGGVILFFLPNEFEKTKADGTYKHAVKHGWSGTVEPTKTGYYFEPENRSFTNVTSHQTGINFTAIKIPLAISGKVSDAFGDGVDGVTLTFTSINGEEETETTGPDGIYTHPVNYGWSGTVTPSKDDLLFDPREIKYEDGVKESKEGEDFHLSITLTLKASRHEERTFLVKKDYVKVNLTVIFIRQGDKDKVENYIIYRTDSDGGQTEIPINPSDLSKEEPYTYYYYDRYLEKNVSYTYKVEARDSQGKVIGLSDPVTKRVIE